MAGRHALVPFLATLAMLAAGCASGQNAKRADPSAPPLFTSRDAAPAAVTTSPGGLPVSKDAEGLQDLNRRLLSMAAQSPPAGDAPLGGGDLIEISVFEVAELSKLKIRVAVGGSIALPLLGLVPAAGRTPSELEDDIRALLQKKYMHDPHVSVFVIEQKSQRVTITGAVTRGGVYPLTPGLRLADALGLAEGLNSEADRKVFLVRRIAAGRERANGSPAAPASPAAPVTIEVDLEELAAGREDLNVVLETGDIVNVPRAGSIFVGGAVEKPGSFLLKNKTTLQQAIVAAGGVTGFAKWSDVRIYRPKSGGDREILTFDLKEIEEGAAPPEVLKNDVVVVGRSDTKWFFYHIYDFLRGRVGTVGP